jgi:hypothetical protein
MPAIDLDFVDSFIEKLRLEARAAKSFLKYREPDQRMLLYLSLGFLSDSYLQAAEEALKQGKGYEATHFTAKATTIRNVTHDTFGEVPEKDYYTGLYKVPKDIVTGMPNEQLQAMAQFCAGNIEMDENLLQDSKALGEELKKQFKVRRSGIMLKYENVLRKAFNAVKEKPTKWGDIYELFLLLTNISMIMEAMEKKAAEEGKQKKDEKGILRGEKEPLAGFKV